MDNTKYMTAHELAKCLLTLPDKPIKLYWDSGARGVVEGIVNDTKKDAIVIMGEDWTYIEDCGYRTIPLYAKEDIVFKRL